MKKLMSLVLSLVMVCSLSVTAFASSSSCDICGGSADIGDYDGLTLCLDCYEDYELANRTYSTKVTYTGDGVSAYEVTVPASLTPGGTGAVKVEGTWATDMTVNVTAPETVTLTNSIDNSTKTLDVTFAGISQAGSNTESISVSKNISVAEITNALFGVWKGTIVYNVTTEEEAELITFTVSGSGEEQGEIVEYQAELGMTYGEWVESDYNTDGCRDNGLGELQKASGAMIYYHSDNGCDGTTCGFSCWGDSVILTDLIEDGAVLASEYAQNEDF